MNTIRSMRAFVRAVELGSLSAVAREHGTTQPTVSKLLAGLERELGVRLLERSSAGLSTTDEGKRFYERALHVLEEFDEAAAEARGSMETPARLLRVSAPLALSELRLNALMLEFLARYPRVEIELILDDRFVDLTEQGMDFALRLGGALPPHMIARRLAVAPRLVVASPGYLRGRPAIERPADLSAHQAVRFAWADRVEELQLHGPDGDSVVAVSGRYRVNSSIAVRDSLLAEAGFELAPAWLVDDLLASGRLVRLLPQWEGPAQEAFLLYPRRRYQPLRTRAFIDFMLERVVQLPGFTP
ncbi:MAG TPA: LysR family transcriptional regulator [Burkholderiaceae bacterium]|nr:LysR family transcriptional regulator [Burkholderiaceae bacterium]